MPRPAPRTFPLVLVLALAAMPELGAAAAPAASETPAGVASDPEVMLGPLTREQVEEAYPLYVQAEAEAAIDPQAARELVGVPPGASLVVYFGTWCSDSRRELGRFWRALDEIADQKGFSVEYVGVDRGKVEPAPLLAGVDLHHVPTFVVRREAVEVGRVVEKSPHGIERDLADLLCGRQQGFLSATQDPPGAAGPKPTPAAPAQGPTGG